jgi:uncharacterized protein YhaN
MKISSLYIDGFGKFHNWKPSTSFGEGLTAIVGPNEAGKTTLLAFIRRMLYGFPDGRKKDLNHYTPINGVKIGGRLEIQGEDGREYILSRTGIRGSPSLTYADGTTARGSALSSLLGPCDQVFYENVCAIGLGELQEISTLRKDEIRDRLAAAGAGNLPVRDVATSLKDSADEIYAVQGKKKRINSLVSDLKGVETKISAVKKSQREYDRINEEIILMKKAVAEEERKQKTVEEEIAYFKALGQAWEAFTEREDARNTLSTIQEIEPFPGDALEKLNRTEEEVQRLEKDYNDLTKEHTGLKEEIERCVVRGEVLEQADTIHALERKIEWYRSQVNDLKRCQQDSEHLEAELALILKSLGGDWDKERVTRFDTSFPAKDDAKQLRDRLAKTANACTVQQSKLDASEKEAEEKHESLQILQRQRYEIKESAVRDEILRQADAIHAVERSIERYQSQGDDLKRYHIELQQKQDKLSTTLQNLGGDWDKERVTRFDTSFSAKDGIKQLRDRLAKSETICAAQKSRFEAAEKEKDEKEEGLKTVQRRRDEIGNVARPDTAREKLSQSRELLREIQYVQELETRLYSIRQEEARVTEIKKSLNSPQAFPSWPGVLVGFLAALVFGWGYLTEALLLAGFVALILLVAAVSLLLLGRKREESSSPQDSVHQYEKEGETFADQRREVERELSEREEKILSYAGLLGLATPPSRTAAEDLVHELEDAVIEAGRADSLDKDISRAEELHKSAEASLKRVTEDREHALAEREEAQNAWRQWCRERGLSETMNPDLIPDLIALIQQAAGLYSETETMKKREMGLSEEIRSFEEKIRGIIAACREAAFWSPDAISEILQRLFAYEEDARRRDERYILSPDFDALPSRKAAEDLVHTLQNAVTESDEACELDQSIADAKEHYSAAEASLKKARENLQHASSEHKDAQDAWRRWCHERGLPETMNPDLIPDLIADIRRAADHYTQIAAMKKREEDLSKDIRSYEGDIITVRDACDKSLKGPHDTILEGLRRMLRDEVEAKSRYNTLTEKLKEKSEKLDETSAQNNKAKTNLENILKECGAKTPEEYRAFERLSRKRQELEESVRHAESAIRRISGEDHYNDFITALQEYDPVRMQVDLQKREADHKKIHDTIEESNQDIGKLTERQSGIEGDHELTRLLSREMELKEDIKQVSRQWAVYTVASSLLGMAVETFERDRQPEILREAQSFFTGITDGRYTRVVKPFDGSDLYVEEATGAQKRIDELSRGTAEQLYLALRFGYIRDYANSSLPVPVIFDDILVNFDPMRRKNACHAIADLAGTCQVLYFTCHPETVRDLTKVIPDAVVMDISKT